MKRVITLARLYSFIDRCHSILFDLLLNFASVVCGIILCKYLSGKLSLWYFHHSLQMDSIMLFKIAHKLVALDFCSFFGLTNYTSTIGVTITNLLNRYVITMPVHSYIEYKITTFTLFKHSFGAPMHLWSCSIVLYMTDSVVSVPVTFCAQIYTFACIEAELLSTISNTAIILSCMMSLLKLTTCIKYNT